MKTIVEQRLLEVALRRNHRSGVVLATFQLDLPQSNGRICLCVFFLPFRKHPAAALQHPGTHWSWLDPEISHLWMKVPTHVYKYIVRRLREYGIAEVIGIEADDKTVEGTPLVTN